MNSKMTPSYQQLTLRKKQNKLSKQPKREQNHKNGDHMEGHQRGGGRGRIGEKVQEIRSINGRYKIGGF